MNRTSDNKVALISGAVGGIGGALCEKFSAGGYVLAALDLNEDQLNIAASQFEPKNFHSLPCNLTDSDAVQHAVEKIEESVGPITALVNNAGFITETGKLTDMTPEKWALEVSVNLNGAYNLTSAILPFMMKRRAGSVVSISSVNALMGFGHAGYSAAKAGLISYGKSVAMEYGPFGIRSNIVLPGTVATPAWRKRADADPAIFEKLKMWYPLGRIATPEDIANAAWFLASREAAAISGAVLNVDAGLTAGNHLFAAELTQESFS